MLESISSTFYARIFLHNFWHPKLQSCILCLDFFEAKISAQMRV
jgi:hypothetical protein